MKKFAHSATFLQNTAKSAGGPAVSELLSALLSGSRNSAREDGNKKENAKEKSFSDREEILSALGGEKTSYARSERSGNENYGFPDRSDDSGQFPDREREKNGETRGFSDFLCGEDCKNYGFSKNCNAENRKYRKNGYPSDNSPENTREKSGGSDYYSPPPCYRP